MIIYETTNLITGDFYIGKDKNNNPNYFGSGLHLKRAIKKYGKENFKKEILEVCQTYEELNKREKYWINKRNAIKEGYNIAEGGDGGKTTDIPWNKGKKGKPTGPCSEERKENIRKSRLKTDKLECPHCNKKYDPGNFKRFHGDKCKLNPNIDPEILEERSKKAKHSMKVQKERGNYSPPKPPKGEFKCPHCEKVGVNYGSMTRHHFDRCQYKTK